MTDVYATKQKKTAEEKALMIERARIGRLLNKIYLELLNSAFPPDDDARLPKPPSTPSTPVVSSNPSTPMDPLASATKSTTPATKNSPMNMEDLSSAIDEILPQKSRPKYQKSSVPKPVETDLFETPEEITLPS